MRKTFIPIPFGRSLGIFILCILSALDISAYDFEVNGIYYNILSSEDKTVEVTYSGSKDGTTSTYSGFVVVPPSVAYDGNTYSVKTIGEYAFYKDSITRVIISNSVTSIGNYAFYYCSGLTSVTIPNSVKSIGDYTFQGCSGLTSVSIPNSVTSIGYYAFAICSGLTKAEFASVESLCKINFGSIFANPLNYAKHLYIDGKEVKDLIIPNSVTSIGSSAFDGCSGLTSVTIPNSVTSIGSSAFSGCSGLTSVTIPNSVTSIGYYAFSSCSGLTKAEFASVESLCKINFGNDSANPLYYAKHLYIDGKEVKDLIIPNSVTSIGSRAFDGCSGLTSVTIPNSVTSIGGNAFYKCTGLTSVTIPNSVTSIGSSAFDGCSGLTSVTIPNSVTSIGQYAFFGCSGLTKAEFASVESLCKINFGNGSANPLYYAKHLYIDGKEVKDLIIPNSVTSIENYAFYYCSGLTSVTIPNSVTSIGSYAFDGCSGLTSITIPNSVTSIGEEAFRSCM